VILFLFTSQHTPRGLPRSKKTTAKKVSENHDKMRVLIFYYLAFWSEWQVDYNGGNKCGQFCKQTKTRDCTNQELYDEESGGRDLCIGPDRLEIGCSPCG